MGAGSMPMAGIMVTSSQPLERESRRHRRQSGTATAVGTPRPRPDPQRPPIGIVAALPGEMKVLRRAKAWWGAATPAVLHSGMGLDAAAAAAEALADQGVAGLVSFGCAGAISPDLACGALLLPDAVEHAGAGRYLADRAWHSALGRALRGSITYVTGPLVSVDRMLASVADKREAYAATGALAVDMESAAVASVASRHRLPFIAVRVVLDDARQVIPSAVTAALDDRGQVALSRLAMAFLFRPTEVLELFGLARAARIADRMLSAVCRLAGPRLGLP